MLSITEVRNVERRKKRKEALKEKYKSDLVEAYNLGKSNHADSWPYPKDDFILTNMVARCPSRIIKNELLKEWLRGKEDYRKAHLKQTTNAFWECDCNVFFVHSKDDSICPVCGADFMEWPSARNADVLPYNLYLNRNNAEHQKAKLAEIERHLREDEEAGKLSGGWWDLYILSLKELLFLFKSNNQLTKLLYALLKEVRGKHGGE